MEKEIPEKGLFTAGVVTARGCCIADPEKRYGHRVIRRGVVSEIWTSGLPEVLTGLGPDDVFIKGVNAIDPFGQAGILLEALAGGPSGGRGSISPRMGSPRFLQYAL